MESNCFENSISLLLEKLTITTVRYELRCHLDDSLSHYLIGYAQSVTIANKEARNILMKVYYVILFLY